MGMENQVSTESVSMELDEENSGNELDMENDYKTDSLDEENSGNELDKENDYKKDSVEDPNVGMVFDSSDDVLEFYLRYGKKTGFAVSKRTSRKGDDGEVRYVTITCAREGKSRRTSKNPIKMHPVSKTGCKARISASCHPDGRWIISSVVLNHNHALSTPSQLRFYRCNRAIEPHVKRRLELNDMAGIRMNKSFNSLVVEAGGYENLQFQEKDCRNYIDKVRRLKLGEGDATAIHNYFLKMQADNSSFFYMMDLDADGRLKNVFWADARSRAAVKEFGDVVTFDTTYLTNKYDMPFAPFVGVNHHGQSVLLGCGLISNEDVETFTWLFKSWLTCMSRTPPNAIITDQDKAMKRAIEVVFPNTRHRWCLWHIMKKLPEKLGANKNYKSIKSCIKTAVYNSLTNEEFEDRWWNLVLKYNLEENEWLSGLYEERNRWVPTFVKDCFWAGMSTTQRSESMNAFFDGYVNSKTSLKQFVEQYENALRSKVEKEDSEDFKSFNSWIPCMTPYEMEKQIQREYTTSKFREFQQEVAGKMLCEVFSSENVNYTIECGVLEDVATKEGVRRDTYKVYFNGAAEEIRCNCRLFQFRGILCRHAITVLIHKNVFRIPSQYILKRWSKNVKRSHTKVKISYDDWSAKPEARRFNKLCDSFKEVAHMVADSDDRSDKVISWIQDLKRQLTMDSCESSQPNLKKSRDITPCDEGMGHTNESLSILSPMVVRTKGRPPSKRMQCTVEKVIKKKKNKKNKDIQATDLEPNKNIEIQSSQQFGKVGGYVQTNPVVKKKQEKKKIQASELPFNKDYEVQASHCLGQVDRDVNQNLDSRFPDLHDFGHSNIIGRYVHPSLVSQSQGSCDFENFNVAERYVHQNWDSQTKDTSAFGHQSTILTQPNIVGFGAMLQQFDIGNQMRLLSNSLETISPTTNASLSSEKD